ncbi:MAG: CBS domain-containing protein [Gammaproteobacteria bacterium]|nr:CBS domain-containing protein [Gammaproteobacteria bacterium]NIR83569.1 CBS domain-containing protein [Gammaproteobacteria bacterium]NIR91491.1 CBS domain-containing protein [Gammaproteobacteria bacterium]NIU04731.1 CBS domain-containing protein [Gammaproteobacteria bacterium]NIV51773.1 CBS domain-containing protein [Gammaproteobacteria bacterium]
MDNVPRIGELMTASPQCVDVSDTVKTAKTLMLNENIKHLPVLRGERLVGILSDRDVKLAQAVSTDPNFHDNARVEDVFRSNPYTVPRSEPANRVLSEMAERRIGSVLIVEDEELIGIFTTTDACRCFADFLRFHFGDGEDEAPTGQELTA